MARGEKEQELNRDVEGEELKVEDDVGDKAGKEKKG
ncbi:uncharacterized protein G2W53_043646 [Senna tora]|uniref:Uncharacterized protein n=1 Tax=Senna tora TaxID=362788 RepID=A0A834SHE3_9FABA|nr:uncharacterized protein G2W53_043646 [Senna tora]